MVEVFKTDMKDPERAEVLIQQIHSTFPGLEANFDLEDCDKILRIECTTAEIESTAVVGFLRGHGWHAEVLSDTIGLQTDHYEV